MRPIYVLAGQSNAGMMARTPLFATLEARKDVMVFDYWVGGSTLAQSNGVDWNVASWELYAHLRHQIGKAIQAGGYLAGVVWAQGESDGLDAGTASAYGANLAALLDRLRADFGDGFKTAVVAISDMSQLANRPATADSHDVVRQAQLVSGDTERGIVVIDPDVLLTSYGLGYRDAFADDKHYSPEFAEVVLRHSLLAVDGPNKLGITLPIVGTGGNDVLKGTIGHDVLVGLAGNDIMNGGAGNDLINGGSGNDLIRGWTGNDTIYGGAGNDRLYGDAGRDVINGGAGNDWIAGGNGDVLTGGHGRDTFVLTRGFGEVKITDFHQRFDTIKIAGARDDYTVCQAGNAAIVEWPNGDELTLVGKLARQVTDDWFGV